jgi:secondary thiamine-phosphate synthase enzyme
MQKLSLKSSRRSELIDITPQAQKAVAASRIKQGTCFIFCPHTTAGLTINENADPSVKDDLVNTLNKLIPENAAYAHSEGNSDSHVKSSLLGSSLTVFIEAGELMLGRWQGIYFCENDGPRSREIWIKVIEG